MATQKSTEYVIYRWVITGYGYGTLIRIKNITGEKRKSFSVTL